MGIVPPRIDSPKTIIGVGTRELIILGVGLLLAILVILTHMSVVLKVGLAALIVGLSALLALGRNPATGNTFEQHFLDIYHFYKRDRFLQRGVADYDDEPSAYQPANIDKIFEKDATKGFVRIRPLPLSMNGFLSVVSFSFLIMLIVWAFFGGLKDLLLRFGIQ